MRFLSVALLALLFLLSHVAAASPSGNSPRSSTSSGSSDASDDEEPAPISPPELLRNILRADSRFTRLFNNPPINHQDFLQNPRNLFKPSKPPVRRRLVFNDENADYPESGCNGNNCTCGCNILLHRPRRDDESSV